ncbi:conserved Plasmodium protein, unknown function [Plasmodium gallinaceum]|uniref:Claudin-like apicomplexan microneme protein n=1 Tax=Plasmodium gallinaceum TaxID=5849 RepID=A0A1J1GXM3_PLAGA|nr:conserved Plasmodium protein, unknown function [Plasmodium gallinaceum]CRG97316.1 conserved Plasmodium protein, unknown function [Plasmodium gallinaceum]
MGRAHKARGKVELPKKSSRFLNVIMVLAFLSAVPQILTTFMLSWRVADPIKYTFMFRGSRHYITFDVTWYGLYRVLYDNKHSETWSQRVDNMKNRGNLVIQQGRNSESAGSLSLWTSLCPEACREAIMKRIESYERVAFISLVLLCSIILSCTIVLLSIGWSILFYKNIFILMGCFILSFIINAGVGGYWYYETDMSWNIVSGVQQYPFPRCSYCFYIFMITTVMYALCFLGLLILDLVNKNKEKKSHMDQINMHNRDPVNAKGMYQPLFGNPSNMMMQRSASFSNLMPFDKGMNNEYPNFMLYNKMNMNPMGTFSSFRNMPPGMPPNMQPNMPPNMQPNMPSHMNPNFFPQVSRQYSYSGSPSFQQNFQNFDNFSMRNMPSMSDLNFARQYSGMNYSNMNNPFNSQKPFKF